MVGFTPPLFFFFSRKKCSHYTSHWSIFSLLGTAESQYEKEKGTCTTALLRSSCWRDSFITPTACVEGAAIVVRDYQAGHLSLLGGFTSSVGAGKHLRARPGTHGTCITAVESGCITYQRGPVFPSLPSIQVYQDRLWNNPSSSAKGGTQLSLGSNMLTHISNSYLLKPSWL